MRRTLVAFSVVVVAIALGIGLYVAADPAPMPSYARVRADYRTSEKQLLDRHGEIIHELRVDATRRRLGWTAIADISPVTLEAVVRAEDRRFFAHRGVDWRAGAGALWNALSGGQRRGASTITMQLAAELDRVLRAPSTGRGPRQKWAQMRAAFALEAGWDKHRILEIYLNLVSFRGELQGITAASRGLFGKTPAGLDAAESWLLAALLGAPNATADRVARRACRLAGAAGDPCRRLATLAQTALHRSAHLAPGVALAPHVGRRLLTDPEGSTPPPLPSGGGQSRARAAPGPPHPARDPSPAGSGVRVQNPSRFRSQDGPGHRNSTGRDPTGAWQIASTLDAGLQRLALMTLRHQLRQLRRRNVRHGAVLAVHNASGEVLAYVGNPGEDEGTFYVDGVQAPRQAGSTLKPFLYALALEARLLTAASPLEDSPVNLTTPTGLYVPENYDHASRGWVSLRTALAGSLNVPAVRTLVLVGTERFVERLRALGFAHLSQEGDYYGYSLALGSAEVTLWELVNAYRSLANGGVSSALTLRPRPAPVPAKTVMQEGAPFIVSDILADRAARSVTFGLDSALGTASHTAVKTGTSKDMRDNWCIGYSPRYTVGVWVGNFSGEPMHEVSGVTGAAPVWHEVMDHLHRGAPPPPRPPRGVVAEDIVFTPPIEAPRHEWFLAGTAMRRIAFAGIEARRPHIVYPGRDMSIALDPDIPAERQRLFLRAEPALPELAWQIDRVPFVSAAGTSPAGTSPAGTSAAGWRPVVGRHRLTLLDANGRIVDSMVFEVRGRR
ncbi:MAG: transglycosylase domain-containing protein [Gammaproteobacteria bacterium]